MVNNGGHILHEGKREALIALAALPIRVLVLQLRLFFSYGLSFLSLRNYEIGQWH
jgi:hypothetical protein